MLKREIVRFGLIVGGWIFQITVVIPGIVIGGVLLGAILAGKSPVQEAVIGIHHWAETEVRSAPDGSVLVFKCSENGSSPICENPTMVPTPIAEAARGASENVKTLYWGLVLISTFLALAFNPDFIRPTGVSAVNVFAALRNRVAGGKKQENKAEQQSDNPAQEISECTEPSSALAGAKAIGPLSEYANSIRDGMNNALFVEILKAFEAEARLAGFTFARTDKYCAISIQQKRRLGMAALKAKTRAIAPRLPENNVERDAYEKEALGGDASQWAEEIIANLRAHGISMVQVSTEAFEETALPDSDL